MAIALYCGVPPVCSCCGENDAKVQIDLRAKKQRPFCESCLVSLIETGLATRKNVAPNKNGRPSSDVMERDMIPVRQ